MKILRFLPLIAVIGSMAFLASCGGGEQPAQKTYNFERADSLPDGYLSQLGIVKTNIEASANLFEHMNSKGLSFSDAAMLPASKSFSGSRGQAMGIGAMGSDLVYAASYGQNQAGMDRMKSLVGLANSLGIAEAFDEKLLEKLASDDSTVNKSVILTKAYLTAKDQLFSDERAQLATFMVVGGWLEGLHVGTQTVKGHLNDQDVRVGYWDICNGYKSVQHMMAVFEKNAEMKSALESIATLGPVLNKVMKNSRKYTEADVAAIEAQLSEVRGKLL